MGLVRGKRFILDFFQEKISVNEKNIYQIPRSKASNVDTPCSVVTYIFCKLKMPIYWRDALNCCHIILTAII